MTDPIYRKLKLLLRMLSSAYDWLTGAEDIQWSRVVMRAECEKLLGGLDLNKLCALEISGRYWGIMPFAQYTSVLYPEFNICDSALPESYDLIIAEQVFEHLLWPYRAGQNVHKMLRAGGYFLVSTPFMVRIHDYPVDCTRWTEIGLKYFLGECGFALEGIQTGSWGN